ncbi:DUF4834 family protein [Parabacteroides sp. An277]|uniref:DUF4834 family protein n=1 Tax=Parabacteroides sp. An277 TaxID=1965619 RepID=UPI001EF49770|nr:DUF4834 family protein [Parabacteroides sp. An277]
MIIKFLFFFVFLFFVLIFLLGFSVLRGIKRLFFGNNRASRSGRMSSASRPNASSSSTYAEEADNEPHVHRRKKVYARHEGEYVDYEEVKE